MKNLAWRCFAFTIGTPIFAGSFVAVALGLWILWHFIAWTPFTGLPWSAIRLAIAAGVLMGVFFACSREETL